MIGRLRNRVIYALTASVGLLGACAGACSLVNFGELPIRVSAISGTVVGNIRFEDAKKPRKRLSGVRVQVLSRTDKKYSKDVVAAKFRSTLPPRMVWEWSCGDLVAASVSRESGHFTFHEVQPGKYCIDFAEGSQPEDPNRPMSGRFLIDVQPQAKYRSVIADITPLRPDCSGGGEIVYSDQANVQSTK